MNIPCGKCCFPIEEGLFSQFGNTMSTPAMIAAKLYHEHCVIAWVEAGVDVACKNKLGETILMLVAEKGLTCALQCLMQPNLYKNLRSDVLKAVNDRCSFLMTPLMKATATRKTKCMELLVHGGAHIDFSDVFGKTALFYATRKDCVYLLKEMGANLDYINQIGDTPLLCAVDRNLTDIVEALLDSGANVNKTNRTGSSPLMVAAYQGNSNIMNTLISHKADLNTIGMYNATAITTATTQGFPDCVKLLLQADVKINMKFQATISASVSIYCARAIESAICIMILYAAGQELEDTTHPNAPRMIQKDNHGTLLREDSHVLKHFCRKAIRKQLINISPHTHLFKQIHALELPMSVKEYLLYNMHL